MGDCVLWKEEVMLRQHLNRIREGGCLANVG